MNIKKKVTTVIKKSPIMKVLPDKIFLKIAYRLKFGKKLDLDNPKTFNEKIQWLKLNDRKDIYTTMVDKYEAKKYVANLIGEKYIIPTLGVWNKFDDIDFDKLPNQFVLKCTHDSGGLVICKDKSKLDIESAKRKINKCLKRNYYIHGREWPYKNVKPRIIAEKYINNESDINRDLPDYKLMCFNGRVRCTFVCTDRFAKNGLEITIFDENWNELPFRRSCPKSDRPIHKPYNYDKMVEFSELLSKDLKFIRVDFYEVNNDLYFGELTFYPGNGLVKFVPDSADEVLGSWLDLKK